MKSRILNYLLKQKISKKYGGKYNRNKSLYFR